MVQKEVDPKQVIEFKYRTLYIFISDVGLTLRVRIGTTRGPIPDLKSNIERYVVYNLCLKETYLKFLK